MKKSTEKKIRVFNLPIFIKIIITLAYSYCKAKEGSILYFFGVMM